MKTYKTKVSETTSGKGYPAGRVNYLPKEYIGKEVEVRLKEKYRFPNRDDFILLGLIIMGVAIYLMIK